MIWIQTGSARAWNLVEPNADDVDFEVDVAEALARCPRYTAHVLAGPYSVAQHSVIGADYLWNQTRDPLVAGAFLLHDAHEAYLGDIATPIPHALAAVADQEFVKPGYTPGYIVRDALKSLKLRHDRAIYNAAGFAFPLDSETKRIVADIDLRMLATERRTLLPPAPMSWGDAIEAAEPLRIPADRFRIWSWPKAADEFRDRLRRWCPAALKRAA